MHRTIGCRLWNGNKPATPADPRSHGPEGDQGPRSLAMFEFAQGEMAMAGIPFAGIEDKGFTNAFDWRIPGTRPAPSARI